MQVGTALKTALTLDRDRSATDLDQCYITVMANLDHILPPMSLLDPVGEARRTLRKFRARLPDQIIDAVRSLTEAQINYAETRRGPAAEYANYDEIEAAELRLRRLLADALDVTVEECDASHGE